MLGRDGLPQGFILQCLGEHSAAQAPRSQVPEARERLINHTSLASPTSSPMRQGH